MSEGVRMSHISEIDIFMDTNTEVCCHVSETYMGAPWKSMCFLVHCFQSVCASLFIAFKVLSWKLVAVILDLQDVICESLISPCGCE